MVHMMKVHPEGVISLAKASETLPVGSRKGSARHIYHQTCVKFRFGFRSFICPSESETYASLERPGGSRPWRRWRRALPSLWRAEGSFCVSPFWMPKMQPIEPKMQWLKKTGMLDLAGVLNSGTGTNINLPLVYLFVCAPHWYLVRMTKEGLLFHISLCNSDIYGPSARVSRKYGQRSSFSPLNFTFRSMIQWIMKKRSCNLKWSRPLISFHNWVL